MTPHLCIMHTHTYDNVVPVLDTPVLDTQNKYEHPPVIDPCSLWTTDEQGNPVQYACTSLAPSSVRIWDVCPPWLVDSGASCHMTGVMECFIEGSLVELAASVPVVVGSGEVLQGTHRGNVQLTECLILYDVLFVPGLARNLVSVNVLAQTFTITFNNEGCFGSNNSGCTFFAPNINNLCEIPVVEVGSFFSYDSSFSSSHNSCHCCTHACDCPSTSFEHSFEVGSTVSDTGTEQDLDLNTGETSSAHLSFSHTENTHDYAILNHANLAFHDGKYNQNVSCFAAGDKKYKEYCESSIAPSYLRGDTHSVSTAT